MSARFYINWPLTPGPITLEGAEAHHLATVSRLRPGDAVCLFNGDGHEYPARITAVARRSVSLEIEGMSTPQRELAFRLEVAAPLPKGDRAQFLVEKLTELGVMTYVPLRTERSVVDPSEGKLEKLQRWVIEASKQCGRNVLMGIGQVVSWQDYCAEVRPNAVLCMAHPIGDARACFHLGNGKSIHCAVGPEGGFTDAEIELGRTSSWDLVNLGPRTLRIETAALTFAATVACGLAPTR